METLKFLLMLCWCIQFQCRTVNGAGGQMPFISEIAKNGKLPQKYVNQLSVPLIIHDKSRMIKKFRR